MWNGNHLFFKIFKTSQFFFKAKNKKNLKMCVYFKDALDFADIYSFLSCHKEFTLDPEMATFLYE